MGKKLSFLKGLILGSFVGGVLGVLFAPKSGKELRKDIALKYKEAKALLEKKLKELGPLTKEAYKKVVDEVTDALEKVKKWDKRELEQIKKKLLKLWKKPRVRAESTGKRSKRTKK